MSNSGHKAVSGTLASIALVTLLSMLSVAQAEDLRVNLVATVDNGPAMENVRWTVYRGDTQSEVVSASNHSTHVKLPAGDYRVVATLTSSDRVVTRARSFHLRTSDSRIVVPMD